jgi:hypothetical protein
MERTDLWYPGIHSAFRLRVVYSNRSITAKIFGQRVAGNVTRAHSTRAITLPDRSGPETWARFSAISDTPPFPLLFSPPVHPGKPPTLTALHCPDPPQNR